MAFVLDGPMCQHQPTLGFIPGDDRDSGLMLLSVREGSTHRFAVHGDLSERLRFAAVPFLLCSHFEQHHCQRAGQLFGITARQGM